MKVRNATVTMDRAKKTDEMTMIASGRPSGEINLADGSISFVDAIVVCSRRL
jgi:hypothetical protein